MANTTVALPVEITVLGGGVRDLGVSALRSTLDKLSSHLDARDGVGGGIFDVFETLCLAISGGGLQISWRAPPRAGRAFPALD